MNTTIPGTLHLADSDVSPVMDERSMNSPGDGSLSQGCV